MYIMIFFKKYFLEVIIMNKKLTPFSIVYIDKVSQFIYIKHINASLFTRLLIGASYFPCAAEEKWFSLVKESDIYNSKNGHHSIFLKTKDVGSYSSHWIKKILEGDGWEQFELNNNFIGIEEDMRYFIKVFGSDQKYFIIKEITQKFANELSIDTIYRINEDMKYPAIVIKRKLIDNNNVVEFEAEPEEWHFVVPEDEEILIKEGWFVEKA